MDDFECTGVSIPDPQASDVVQTGEADDQGRCCKIVGMCSGNDAPQADVGCAPPSQLVPDARTIHARDADTCCHTTGMCKGNSNVGAEPDIECEAADLLQPKPHGELIRGRDTDACCKPLFCAGNANEEMFPNVVCEAPKSLRTDASTTRGRDASVCCVANGLCAGNDDPGADVQCPPPRTLKQNARSIYGHSPDECCECDPHAESVNAYCLATSSDESIALDGDTDNVVQLADNHCTQVMAYAGDGQTGCNGVYEPCRTDSTAELPGGRKCEDCQAFAPYPTFQQLADQNTAQSLCVGEFIGWTSEGVSRHFTCTYVFRRSDGRCITGMCTGNSDKEIDPDIECPGDRVLVQNSQDVAGRTVGECCTRRGYCTRNSAREHQPDITCEPPMRLIGGADAIIGRSEEACCERTGMCTGNTDGSADVICDADSHETLKPDSASIEGRTQAVCCEITGMCRGNTDQPDVECTEELPLYFDDAFSRRFRTVERCCKPLPVTGMCAGNTDKDSEPDINCETLSPYDDFSTRVGRTQDECCHCVDAPDGIVPIATCTLSTRSGPRSGQYSASTSAGGVAADENSDCARIMSFAACGDDEDILRCVHECTEDDVAHDESCPEECRRCVQSPQLDDVANGGGPIRSFPEFSRRASGEAFWAQNLCLTAGQYDCTYVFRQVERQPCPATGMCTGNGGNEADFVCGDNRVLKADSAAINCAPDVCTPQLCCDIIGMCLGNTDSSDDVQCPSPTVLRPDAGETSGSTAAECCITTGMCTGNSNPSEEPNVACDASAGYVLRPDASSIHGRDDAACCHKTGMCTGNTDSGAEPDVGCEGLTTLVSHSETVRGRSASACCENVWCAGNRNEVAYPNIQCELPYTPRADGHQINARDQSSCCAKQGLCTGNDDSAAEPPVVCVGGRRLKDNAHEILGRRPDECCDCRDPEDLGDSYCVPTEGNGATEDTHDLIGRNQVRLHIGVFSPWFLFCF